MKSIWSGSLSFGLVNIPIQLYPATDDKGLDLDMLHKKDLSPIRFVRVCRAEEKEIPYQELVRGYEIEKGNYVVLTDEDFQHADVKKTQSIEIVGFSDANQIDSIYFEKPYYLEPDKGSDKAYALLREALRQSKKVGIARFVLRNREHLGVIKDDHNIILLNQIRFKDEIRDASQLKLPEMDEAGKREMEMALKLINELTERFKPEAYKDTYEQELRALIQKKAEGKAPTRRGKEPKPTKVIDLMSALRASLEKKQGNVVHLDRYRQKTAQSQRKTG